MVDFKLIIISSSLDLTIFAIPQVLKSLHGSFIRHLAFMDSQQQLLCNHSCARLFIKAVPVSRESGGVYLFQRGLKFNANV